jgi:hypothetical protein
MKRSDLAIALALALCVVGLVACGGGGSGSHDGVAREEAGLEFAECVRAHGVAIEDPKPGQSIDLGAGANDPKTKAALAACNGLLEGGQELSTDEDEELKEGALAFAKCMREEGIEMGDPTFLGPGKFHFDIAGLDTESPVFEAAEESCKGKLPELDLTGVGG